MLIRAIVLLIFGGFGLFMLYMGATQFVQQRRLLSTAQLVDAEIIHSQVRSITGTSSSPSHGNFRNGTTTSHSPEVQFAYRYQGVSYQSDMIYPTIISSAYGSRDSAQEEIESFPKGAHVKAYVSSAAPEKAFLKAESGAGPVVFMIVGLALLPCAWLLSKVV